MASKKKRATRARKPGTKPPPQPVSTSQPPQPHLPPDAEAPFESISERPGPPVAGIGASAGGLDAFKKFFAAMPADSGIAFVLVPHLDPAHESLMVELLARHTTMPVVEAGNDMPVEANHVYILPPNKYMTIQGGILRLTGPVERRTSQTSIDLFLRSLADDQQDRSICIILSGTGSHGTLGLKAVKAAGGMAMVQHPRTADYERMPQSAVDTGQADYVLPVEEMPEALVKYVRHAYVNGRRRIEESLAAADQLTHVLALLKTRSKFDFRCYRKRMLTRRIERRMGLAHIDSMSDYMSFLREHPEEVKQLLKDLFISVTSFFRDGEACEHLARDVIAPLVQRTDSDEVLRVWVPGCASGEEAYSIAILILEALSAARKSCRVQIFATDVDEDALEVARQGIYPESIAADVTAERLSRFFTRVDERTYQVAKPLRESVIFAVQNLISDAPFTKLDLVSCRNLLIYLEPDVQKKVITLFHFALSEGGFLFLGPSETIGRQIDLFEPVSKKWRIYRRIGPARPERVDFPIAAAAEARGMGRRPAEAASVLPVNFAEVTQRLLLEEFAPAAVLINRKYEIFYYFGPCSQYLELPTGEPVHDVIQMAREGLPSKLRGAVHRAIRENEPVVLSGVRVKRNGSYQPVRVSVRPIHLPKAAEGLLLVTFQPEPGQRPVEIPSAVISTAEAAGEAALRQLEDELKATREDLQSTIEEMESSNEELKASNEEVMSMNEELQSANEELETSKEELQSLNEELTTVNNQLQDKIGELEKLNNDMSNLLNCTDIATVFLDSDFRIKLYTPAATRLFSLIASDLGRPIGDIAPRFRDPEMLGDAQQVLNQLVPRERELASDGAWWNRRIMPYRTRDNRIEGVVVTFVDITERKLAADAVVRRLAAIVDNSADAIYSNALDGTIQTWNQAAERLFGYTPQEALGGSVKRIVPEDRMQEWSEVMARLARGEYIQQFDTERICKEGQRIPVSLTFSPLFDADGKVISASVIARSMAERQSAQEALRREHELTESIINTAPSAILVLDSQGRILRFNPFFEQLSGRRLEDVQGRDWFDTFLPERDRATIRALFARAIGGEPTVGNVNPIVTADGRERDIEWHDARIPGPDGKTECLLCLGHDITDRRRAEQALRDSEERLQAILNSAADAIITADEHGIIQSFNPAAERMFGYRQGEVIGQNVKVLMPSPFREEHDSYLARYLATGEARIIGISREVVASRKDGTTFPADLAVSELRHQARRLFIGIHRDLSQRKELQAEILRIATDEQQRIGQELHDNVQQQLTGLGLLAENLAEALAHSGDGNELSKETGGKQLATAAARVAQGVREALEDTRLLARGLIPVEVDGHGLMSALSDLAAQTSQLRVHSADSHETALVTCTFRCDSPVEMADNFVATHLFRIAQEAVTNALKHGHADRIEITLAKEMGQLSLAIQDNGRGVDENSSARPADSPLPKGMGLRIMGYRAALIGAILKVERLEPRGTRVLCTLRGRPQDPPLGA